MYFYYVIFIVNKLVGDYMKRLSVIVLLFCFILVGCSREDEIKLEDKEEEKSIYTINKVLMGIN